MQSETARDSWSARYSDGQSAKSWSCTVRLESRGLAIDRGGTQDELIWPYGSLHSHTMLSRGTSEAIIETNDQSGAQLFVRDPAFIKRLSRIAPQITARGGRRRWLVPVMALAAIIVGLFAALWHLDVRPAQAIARAIPDGARQTLGRNVIKQFTTKSKACSGKEGLAALDILMKRLLKNVPNAKLYNVSVIKMPVVNAFAVPGGQMVLTEKLIKAARSPDEVAGVLAHEIGHGIKRHPEAGVIRAFGISFLIDLVSGGSSGSLGGLGVMLLQTGYVRRDERAADTEALTLLKKAAISPKGLGDFFARSSRCKPGDMRKDAKAKSDCNDKAKGSSKFGGALDLLRTHPYPRERLKRVRRISSYPATPALSDAQWQALRRICYSSTNNDSI